MKVETTKLYVEILADELKRRQRVNPKYSLRSFAQTLGIHSSSLSAILKGKRNLPVSYVDGFSQVLKLSEERQKVFKNSVRSEQLRIQRIPMPSIEELKFAENQDAAPEEMSHIPEEMKHFVSMNVITTKSKIAGAKKILDELKAKLYVYLKDIEAGDADIERVNLTISLSPEANFRIAEAKGYDSVSSSSSSSSLT